MYPLSLSVLARALEVATEAARDAGALLLKEFLRPGGPRGAGGHAPVDAEAEQVIRARLVALEPRWGFVGEETGSRQPDREAPYWLVDPNDGTSAYLDGHRGSAVSIALVVKGAPVLGVVFAFASPDDDGDLFAWADGLTFTRNGVEVARRAMETELEATAVVLLNHDHERYPVASASYTAPARFRCVPSIAHRLALLAAGDADGAAATGSPVPWDVAGGHALLRAVGATLVDSQGVEVRYDRWSGGSVYGGSETVAKTLAARRRAVWGEAPAARINGLGLVGAMREKRVVSADVMRRAQGALLGQVAGDALGGLVEFRDAVSIRASYPRGVRELADGGTWGTLAGQPTDDSEMALLLARTLVRDGGHDPARVVESYRAWLRSSPFDIGATTRSGLADALRHESLANGSLMRVSPLAVWAHALPDEQIAVLARSESAITHPNSVCCDACAVYCVALAHAIRGEGARTVYEAALEFVLRGEVGVRVRDAVVLAAEAPPEDMVECMGLVTKALQNAFYQLLHAPDAEAGIIATASAGGDTDTNAAIAGALLGAVYGREGIPERWRRAVLSCHPAAGIAGVRRARPSGLWPVDVLTLAEQLISCDGRRVHGPITAQGCADAEHPGVALAARRGRSRAKRRTSPRAVPREHRR